MTPPVLAPPPTRADLDEMTPRMLQCLHREDDRRAVHLFGRPLADGDRRRALHKDVLLTPRRRAVLETRLREHRATRAGVVAASSFS